MTVGERGVFLRYGISAWIAGGAPAVAATISGGFELGWWLLAAFIVLPFAAVAAGIKILVDRRRAARQAVQPAHPERK